MRRALALSISSVLLLSLTAWGQISRGLPPFGSFSSGTFDTVNNGNLNVHFEIPILKKNGRGLPFYYVLAYDSSVWNLSGSNGSGSWTPVANWGWSTVTDGATGYVAYSVAGPYECVAGTYPNLQHYYWSVYWHFAYLDAFGSPHSFGTSAISTASGIPCANNQPPGSATLVASDGSGYTLDVSAGSTAPYGPVYSTAGASIYAPYFSGSTSAAATQKYDSNGNGITSNGSSFTDTLGTTALTVSGSGTPSSPIVFSYPAPSGATAQYKVQYATYTVQTNFGCSGDAEFAPASENLVSEIDLPDDDPGGTRDRYVFSYEQTPGYPSSVTGRIHSVTLPTGGTITYDYVGGSNGIECSDYGSTAGLQRYTPDSGSSYWSYSRSQGSGSAWTTTITDPQANQTVIQLQEDGASNYYETERQGYQGSSTLLKAVYTCYNGSTTPCNSTAVSLPITERAVTTQWPDNLESQTAISYNSYGLLTATSTSAYGSGAPGSPIRSTAINYASLGNGIVDRPSSVTIEDGSYNVISQTTYGYDETPVVETNGTPQHWSVSGSRGNVTTVQYLVSGSTYLKKTFTYFDTGNVDVATDVNGAHYTYGYSGSGGCGASFVTSVTEPISPLSKSFTWDCNGGVELTATDENGQTVAAKYTNAYFWRPDSAQDQMSPPNTTNLTYNGQTSVESTLNFSNSTTDVLATLDSLGRPSISQRKQSPSSGTYDSVETTYDPLGRPTKVTLPYAAGSGTACSGSCPGTTTTYDALGRPLTVTDSGGLSTSYQYNANDVLVTVGPAPSGENAKEKQYEYDALGRLTSVCEITSSLPGNGSCGQNTPANGYLTQYTYDALGDLATVTQGAQTRTYNYDGLGRMTSEKNPESGTTTYYYDVIPSGCYDAGAASSGDLVGILDNAGSLRCPEYDALHRVIAIGSNTGCRRFYYDNSPGATGTRPSGITVNDGMGRMIEAETDNCGSPITPITDEWFSYDARGEVTDLWQSTPHSAGYYHSIATYWPNGQLDHLGEPLLGYSISYALDGEGRPYSTFDGGGQNPLSSTLYNSAGQPTQVNFGSGDSDSFSYDTMNRMKEYSFNVGSQSVIGSLTWNANGSLGNLTITDPFNSANSQNCNYTHDDLSRIVNVSCSGSGFSDTYSYDAFGNLTKTGTEMFQPSYSQNPPTNQMVSIGSCTPTYNADGDVLNDCLNSYSWDAYGRPTTINDVSVTYDALGRMVEQNRSGTYDQIVYSPTGFEMEIWQSGNIFVKSFTPLPAGAMAVYTPPATPTYYRHADWLGSSRLASTPSRTVYYDGAYGPFGEPYAQSGTTDLNFTGMNQDTSPNVYDFPMREYGIQGRWPSPDPAGLAAVDPSDPQTWNRYAYVRNSPLNRTDPTGMAGECWQDCENGWQEYQEGLESSGYFSQSSAESAVFGDSASGLNDSSGGGDGASNSATPAQSGSPDSAWFTDFFSASYNGPAYTSANWGSAGITSPGAFISQHTGITISSPGQPSYTFSGGYFGSCAPSGATLSNSCSAGYQFGKDLQSAENDSEKYVNAVFSGQPHLRSLPYALLPNTAGLMLPASLKPTCTVSSVMTDWVRQMKAWLAANPRLELPLMFTQPPSWAVSCATP